MATAVQGILAEYSAISGGGTLALGSAVTVGNTILILGQHSYLGCPPNCTDSLGNTYTRSSAYSAAGGYFFYVWTAPITTGGTCTVTFTMSCGSMHSVALIEVSGLAASPYDQHSAVFSAAGSSPFSGPTITGGVANLYYGILIGTSGAAVTTTAGGEGHVKRYTNIAGTAAYCDYQQATAAAFTPTFTWTGTPSVQVNMASIKTTGGGAPAVTSTLTLLGVG